MLSLPETDPSQEYDDNDSRGCRVMLANAELIEPRTARNCGYSLQSDNSFVILIAG